MYLDTATNSTALNQSKQTPVIYVKVFQNKREDNLQVDELLPTIFILIFQISTQS